jgi:hypothetical protein
MRIMVPNESSLDRFLRTRGGVFSGVYGNLAANRIQLGVGIGLIGISAVMVGAALSAPNLHGLLYGSIGSFIPGVINIAVSLSVRRRLERMPYPKTQLTPEARSLLSNLLRRFTARQYAGTWMMTGMGCNSWKGQGMMELDPWTGMTLKPIPARAMEDLETAAAAYNRVSALAEVSGSENTSLGKLMPRIVQAADDAMAEVLHYVAISSKYPEAEGPTQQRIRTVTARMNELATRADSVFGQEATIQAHQPAASIMDEVLEELRFEGLARQELGEEPEPRQNIRG